MFKCTYIEEIGKALALLHMICHLALPSLVPTFINEAIPDLLHKTVKPTYLAEPRSQSACQLIVWSLVSLSQQGTRAIISLLFFFALQTPSILVIIQAI